MRRFLIVLFAGFTVWGVGYLAIALCALGWNVLLWGIGFRIILSIWTLLVVRASVLQYNDN